MALPQKKVHKITTPPVVKRKIGNFLNYFKELAFQIFSNQSKFGDLAL